MKLFCGILLAMFSTLVFQSCSNSTKLEQEKAEKVIKVFISQNSFSGGGTWGQSGTFNVEAISKIDPISQFSETQANAIVNFNYHDAFAGDSENLILKFIFNKNVDKKWVLTSVEPVQGVGSDKVSNWLSKNQNINMVTE